MGVSRYSANIMTIGGRYESRDHDLLATAVREYNEEVGMNLINLSEEDVYGCYAVQSKYSVAIFYPIDCLPTHDFVPTDELYDVIWVTPHQLKSMASHQHFILRHPRSKKSNRSRSNTRAFLFSNDLKLLATTIAAIAETSAPFNVTDCNINLHRLPRLSFGFKPMLCTDTNVFLQDCTITPNWGNIALVFSDHEIAIMRGDRSVYILPIQDLDYIIDGLNRLNIKNQCRVSS